MVLAARTAGDAGRPAVQRRALRRPGNPPSGTSLSGNVAEWIVEDPSTIPDHKLYPFPNYGSTFLPAARRAQRVSNSISRVARRSIWSKAV
jgi:hypothetical protein